MTSRRRISRYFLQVLSAGGLTLVLSAAAIGAPDALTLAKQKSEYERRLVEVQSIRTALSREPGSAGAGETLRQVDSTLQQAAEKARGEEYESAGALLNQSYSLLKTALVRAKSVPGPAKPTAAENVDGIERRNEERRSREHVWRDIEYTRSLLDALKRQSGVGPQDIASIERDIASTEQLLQAGKTAEADRLIDSIYARAKVILSGLQPRQPGQTGSAALEATTRAAATAQDTSELRARFSQREASAMALYAAFEAMVRENPERRPVLIEAEKDVAEARQLVSKGQYRNAIAALDRAYLLLKLGIAEVRGGQQVTASKTFASAADEYRYEQERNDDYAQLIDGLIDRTPRATWSESRQISLGKRRSADQAAQSGDWLRALEQIGESTGELKKILRSAGFPII